VIDATWSASDLKINRLKRELDLHLATWPVSDKERSRMNKKISIGRKIFERKHPGVFSCTGTLSPQFIHDIKGLGLKEFRHFGGTKFILRGKYKPRDPFASVRDLPIGITEEDIKEMIEANRRKFHKRS
jgi:hypothetical protein